MKTVEIKIAPDVKVSLNVKERIKYGDLCTIATAIRNDVFPKEGGYFPYMKNLGLVHYVLLYYADYTFADADEMMELYACGALVPVFKIVDAKQLALLDNLVEDMVDYRRNQSGLDAVCDAMLREIKKQQLAGAETEEKK